MDKETISQYGWIVVLIVILSVMIALATPFATATKNGVIKATDKLTATANNTWDIISNPTGKTLVTVTHESIQCSASGRVISVESTLPCKVGYSLKENESYTVIPATPNPDGSYSFTIPEGVAEVVVAIRGDVDLDGDVDSDDVTFLACSLLPDSDPTYVVLNNLQYFAADTNDNGDVNSSDRVLISKSLLDPSHDLYTPLKWAVAP